MLGSSPMVSFMPEGLVMAGAGEVGLAVGSRAGEKPAVGTGECRLGPVRFPLVLAHSRSGRVDFPALRALETSHQTVSEQSGGRPYFLSRLVLLVLGADVTLQGLETSELYSASPADSGRAEIGELEFPVQALSVHSHQMLNQIRLKHRR